MIEKRNHELLVVSKPWARYFPAATCLPPRSQSAQWKVPSPGRHTLVPEHRESYRSCLLLPVYSVRVSIGTRIRFPNLPKQLHLQQKNLLDVVSQAVRIRS